MHNEEVAHPLQKTRMARDREKDKVKIAVSRYEPEMRRAYQRLAQRKCRALARVALARKLAVRLYWMLREEVDYVHLLYLPRQDSSSHFVVVVDADRLSGRPASPNKLGSSKK
jgi:hypothetical protein